MAGELDIQKVLRLKARRFLEWKAYSFMEPFGEKRADYRAASIRETVFNIAVEEKYRRPLDDFLLSFGLKDEEETATVGVKQSPAEQERLMCLMFGIPLEATKIGISSDT